MKGTMLWFNLDKGFGFIQTEHDERLYVARSGFAPEHSPTERCAGRLVSFDREEEAQERDACAVNVVFPVAADPRRARLRHSRMGMAL
ncbi:MAG: cold shock domain-containing protein [Gaiellaceae bacterium]|jgi:cold shock CspA family protein